MHVSLAPSSNGWCQASVGVYRRILLFILYVFKHAGYSRSLWPRLFRGSHQPWPEDLMGGTGMGLVIPGHTPTVRDLSTQMDCIADRPLWCKGLLVPHHSGCTRFRGPVGC